MPQRHERSALADSILQYPAEHEQAADTAFGIARCWIGQDDAPPSAEVVEVVLADQDARAFWSSGNFRTARPSIAERAARRERRLSMPSALTFPGVYIEELPSGVRTITGVATSVAGVCRMGPRGTAPTTPSSCSASRTSSASSAACTRRAIRARPLAVLRQWRSEGVHRQAGDDGTTAAGVENAAEAIRPSTPSSPSRRRAPASGETTTPSSRRSARRRTIRGSCSRSPTSRTIPRASSSSRSRTSRWSPPTSATS